MDNLVSIILPVYNGESFLAEAIESCLKQTHINFELIIVNDCSTDNSLEIATYYRQKDKRINIINNQHNQKLPASLNIGHRAAKGDYLTWTSDDNILKPDFIKVLKYHLDFERVDIVFGNYDIILDDGTIKRTHKTGPLSHLLFGNTIGAAFMYKSKVFQKLDGFDVTIPILEDYDFWLRASTKFKFYHINQNIYKYRLHKKSLTSTYWHDEKRNEKMEAITRYVYKNFCRENSFSKETAIMLLNINRQSISFQTYSENFYKFRNDLLRYNKLIDNKDRNTNLKKLNVIVRDFFKKNIFEKNFSTFLWLLKNQRGVLLSNTYSISKTVKLIKDFIFHF